MNFIYGFMSGVIFVIAYMVLVYFLHGSKYRIRLEHAEEILKRANTDALHKDECQSIEMGPYIDVIHSGKPCSCGVEEFINSLRNRSPR